MLIDALILGGKIMTYACIIVINYGRDTVGGVACS